MPASIKAVIFDFDGTLMDTESWMYEAFCEAFAQYGQTLPWELWAQGVGTVHSSLDPRRELERLAGCPIDAGEFAALVAKLHLRRLNEATLRPGVIATLNEARRLGLRIGLASSADRAWIERHLHGQSIVQYFACVFTKDEVERVKPDPQLYRRALAALAVDAGEAVAFEDSLNGLLAAKAAGMRTIVVTNAVTQRMDLSAADLRIATFENESLLDLFARLPA